MQQKPMTEILSPDYAKFQVINGQIIPGENMLKKLAAITFPEFKDKRVLDVGCDYGQFSFWAAAQGAKEVVGLDRNRTVRGVGQVDLVRKNNDLALKSFPRAVFYEINLGKQWVEYGKFDVVLMMNMYHHVFENVGAHLPIWFWLHRHCAEGSQVIWESPLDLTDGVSDEHIKGAKREDYTKEKILAAASEYFDFEHTGEGHVGTRSVYVFRPKKKAEKNNVAHFMDGAGGATPAFLHENGRRMREIARVMGYIPHPGSLNLLTTQPFDWTKDYYRAEILDVSERGKGLNVDWKPRWARFYPVKLNGIECHAFKFEGEKYPENFVELIAPVKLRSVANSPAVLS